jgi:hypothetical protein
MARRTKKRTKVTSKRRRERRTSPRVATSASLLLQMCETGTFVWHRHDGGAEHHDVHRHIEVVAGSALVQKTKGKRSKGGRRA